MREPDVIAPVACTSVLYAAIVRNTKVASSAASGYRVDQIKNWPRRAKDRKRSGFEMVNQS